MPELRELKKKEDLPDSRNKSSKLLIGLLSLLVFVLLFVFLRDKKEVSMDSESPLTEFPSPEDGPSDKFLLDSFDEDNPDKILSGGKILIGPEDDPPGEMPLGQEEKIIPIPKEELAFFESLQGQEQATSPQAGQAPPASISPGSKEVYTIQLGAFKNKQGAHTLSERLRKAGYDAYLLAEKGQLYKVRVGEYRSREAAKKVADQIRKSERLDSFITRDE